MNAIPGGAQRSEDGQWWWDGTEWQPVDAQAGESGEGLAPVSEDHFAQMLDAAEGEATEA